MFESEETIKIYTRLDKLTEYVRQNKIYFSFTNKKK